MTTQQISPHFQADVLAALSSTPDVHWIHGDDLCSCTFQRIGEWTNPYLAQTLRVRLCCIWAEIYKQYPQFVQEINASYDSNRHEYVSEPQPWDSPGSDMPTALWYRQLARLEGRSLDQVRAEYSQRQDERPRAVKEWASKQPAEATVQAARNERLRLSGWL